MLSNILYKISAERSDIDHPYLSPFFFQQQKAYTFCKKHCKNKIVLEIGSGSGFGANRLAEIANKVDAVDKDSMSIEKCKVKFKRNNLRFINKSIELLKAENKYDIVVSLQVIEHIMPKSVIKYLKLISSALKQNGVFILSTPNDINSSYNENPYHYKEYSQNELIALLTQFFRKVEIFNVIGDNRVNIFEKNRKKAVLSFLNKDYFKLRNIIPIKIRQILFDILSFSYRISFIRQSTDYKNITENNYRIVQNRNDQALDLIAVCRDPLSR